uniref:NADH-ubiquinone oxidoreductase 9 kDa subunit n=1 Tax=Leptobrachium leishanense TaxID=445787 RepID=A0A8C5LUG4_9ANUR
PPRSLLVEVGRSPRSLLVEVGRSPRSLLVEVGRSPRSHLVEVGRPPRSLPPGSPASDLPFDNSRYQNLQHHVYTPFTFVDYDVDLSQFRLPQPSSGRPSPRS